MSATREDDNLIFTQKLSFVDYFFVYADGDNNVVSLIQPTPDRAYTTEDSVTDKDVVGTMVDDMMGEM